MLSIFGEVHHGTILLPDECPADEVPGGNGDTFLWKEASESETKLVLANMELSLFQ